MLLNMVQAVGNNERFVGVGMNHHSKQFILEEVILPPTVDFNTRTWITYFKLFWDNSITKKIAEETNLYSVQKAGTGISTTEKEIEQFLGIQI